MSALWLCDEILGGIVMKQLKSYMVNHRQTLHQMPEQGFKEVKTSAYLKAELVKLGYEPESVAKTGLIVYKQGESSECVAFRADMDALSIKEETNVSYASTNGCMHACGHDGHMAILLGWANYLQQINLKKSVLLIFQPAEEGPGGAKVILQEGVFERFNVKQVFGLHIYPNVLQGNVGICPDITMAQTADFDVIVTGKSGHGAMPHTSVDAIVATSHLVSSYQSIVSRHLNPLHSGVVTIGTMKGEGRRNIICEEVVLEGTIRALSHETYDEIKKRMVEIGQGIEAMFNVSVQTLIRDLYPCLINDAALVKSLHQSSLASKLVTLEPMMIAEDFSFYLQRVPGVFFMLGAKNVEAGYTHPLHSCFFNFDDEVLVDGLKLYDEVSTYLGIY